MQDLKEKTLRGGVVKLAAQGANFALRIGSLAALARLLDPEDFGLVSMVTVIAGVFAVFRDAGLSTVTVQREAITDDEVSALFWINMLVGAILAALLASSAPILALFYGEPRISPVAFVMAWGFIFNAAGVQHSALLTRQMRFGMLAAIEVASLVGSISIGILIALAGFRYWALVAMTVAGPVVSTAGYWFAAGWIPKPPRPHAGVWAMLRFGGTVTLNGLVVYVAYNLDKMLIGKLWGAEAIGIYGRAYQLISIPTDNLNAAVSGVAVSALSRLQSEPRRLEQYFLKGYSLTLALTLPVTVCCALFADEIIAVVLGPKWTGTATAFRLLAPTVIAFALINPLGWMMYATGQVDRSLKMAFVIAPVVILGYVLGLPYGPEGVALGFSSAMMLLTVPMAIWAMHGSPVSIAALTRSVRAPVLASVVASLAGLGLKLGVAGAMRPLPQLVIEVGTVGAVYLFALLLVFGQRQTYVDLFRDLTRARSSSPTVA